MSVDALSQYESEFSEHLNSAVSEFTETATINDVVYYGIFDEHTEIESKDKGNILPSQPAPRFWLKEKPMGLVKDTAIIIRSITYKVIRSEPDKNGGYLIFLRLT